MRTKPYVIIRSAISLDGYLNDCSDKRLILSNEEDLLCRDKVRSQCDAIMVGAGTLRTDNPSLVVHCNKNRELRINKGLAPNPIRVTLTRSGNLRADYSFFQQSGKKIVYCAPEAVSHLQKVLPEMNGDIKAYPNPALIPEFILDDFTQRGVRKLLIEGGSKLNTLFLTREDLVDEVQLSIAPFFVGDAAAPKFVNSGHFPYKKDKPLHLVSVDKVGTMTFARYVRHIPEAPYAMV